MTMDSLWLLVCILALLFMQLGFCLLEAGYVRGKNTINVVIKNSIDLSITLLVFTVVGYGVMFGTSLHGLIGSPESLLSQTLFIEPYKPSQVLEVLVFSLFCATAATIISGAAAERMAFIAYLSCSLVIASVLFPVVGHWIWSDAGWLNRLGFIDFSGAIVVHSLGGWAALAVVLCLGPRSGRYTGRAAGGDSTAAFRPDNVPYIACGSLILWVAWLGFNGAGYLGFNNKVPLVLLNTLLSGSAAMIVGMGISYGQTRKANVLLMMNCGLGGLVASTAVCHLMVPVQAIVLGALAGGVVFLSNNLLEFCRVDDVVGAIPVHLGCGVFSALSVPFFLEGGVSFFQQFVVQLIGVITVGLLSFPAIFILIKLLNRCVPVRVSKEAEMIGLNVAEHDARTPMLDILVQMSEHSVHNSYDNPIPVSSQDEAGHIATFYNTLMRKTGRLHSKNRQLSKSLDSAGDKDPLTQSFTRRAWLDKLIIAHHEQLHSVLVTVVLVKITNLAEVRADYGEAAADAILNYVCSELNGCQAQGGYIGRINDDEFGVLLLDVSQLQGEALAETIAHTINDVPFIFSDKKITVVTSLLVRSPAEGEDVEAFLHTLQQDAA